MADVRYFVPGPAFVAEEVRRAMTRPIVPHRSPEFRALYDRLGPRLAEVFRTRGEVMTATASATFLTEAALISLAPDNALCVLGGAFSERWCEVARRLGKEVATVDVPWGRAVDPDDLRNALRAGTFDAMTVVHNETSTGVLNPLPEIARTVAAESDALLLVDAVSSLGGSPVETDRWGLDLVVSGPQKALALPPGLVPFALSQRAAARAEAVAPRGFYTDLLRYRDKHGDGGTITTPAIPQFYALDLQLDRILEEGMEARWDRHRAMATATVEWAESAGFTNVAEPDARSWTVSCLRPPQGVEAPALVEALGERGFTVAKGYGRWRESTLRIGHMGEVGLDDLQALFAAIDECAQELRNGLSEKGC